MTSEYFSRRGWSTFVGLVTVFGVSIVWADKDTRHVYGSGPEVLAEYDVASNGVETLERWFVHSPAGGFPDPLIMVDLTDAGDLPAGQAEVLYYLKDALGSVLALADAGGQVVERYAYDPYGQVTVLTADGTVIPSVPPLPSSYYHDADLDGDVDGADDAHFEACSELCGGVCGPPPCTSGCPATCLFVHDRNGDHRIDVQDGGMLADCTGNGSGQAPPERCRRPPTGYFDVDGDGALDLYDFGGLQECFGVACEWVGPGGGTWDCPDIPSTLCRFVYDVTGHAEGGPDGTVDLTDFAVLEVALAGPGTVLLLDGQVSRYGNPFLWTGQRYEAFGLGPDGRPTGLVHFHARSYSPALGRFLQRDALGVLSASGDVFLGGVGDAPSVSPPVTGPAEEYPDGLNLYQYVGSNPINLTDPFGLDVWDEDVDAAIAAYYGDRAAAAGAVMAQAGLAFNMALLVGQFAVSMMPGGDAALLMGKLAAGQSFTWGDVAGAGLSLAGMGWVGKIEGAYSTTRMAYKAGGAVRKGYRTFEALKDALGPAGPGRVWHHIVEQSQMPRFPTEAIQNVDNVVAVPWKVNHDLGRLYSTIRKDLTYSETLTVRQWLKTKSFDFNRQFGLEAIWKVEQGMWP